MNLEIDIEVASPSVGLAASSDAAEVTLGALGTLDIETAVDPFNVEVESVESDVTFENGAPVILVATPGPPGVAGQSERLTLERTTSYALSGQRAVTTDDAGALVYASSGDLDHLSRPVWLTTGAWGPAVVATLTAEGQVTEPSWSWTPGEPIWLGINGVLTQTIPPGSLFIRELAEVIDPQSIVFRPESPIVKG